jgi:hypothetical protein
MYGMNGKMDSSNIFRQGIREAALCDAKVDVTSGSEFTLTLKAPVNMHVDVERMFASVSFDAALANSAGMGYDLTPLVRWSSLSINSSRNLIRGGGGAAGATFSPYRRRHWFRHPPVYLPANQSIVLKGTVTVTGGAGQACIAVPCIADDHRGELARPSNVLDVIRQSGLVQLPLASAYAAIDGSKESATSDSGGIVDVGSLTIAANTAPTSNFQGLEAADLLQIAQIQLPGDPVLSYSGEVNGATKAIPGSIFAPERIGFRGIDFGLWALSNNQSVSVTAATGYSADASGTYSFQCWTAPDGRSVDVSGCS